MNNFTTKEYNSANQIYITRKNNKFGFLNKSGEEISPPIFDFYHLHQGFVIVRKGNQVGNLFFYEGHKEPLTYREVETFEVIRDGKYGVDSKDGSCIVPCLYDAAKIYYKIIVCRLDNEYFLFNTKGKRIVDMPFEEVDVTPYLNFHHYNFLNSPEREFTISRGIAVKKEGKWGVISQNGKWIIQPSAESFTDIESFQYRQEFQRNYYTIKINGKKGIIKQNGIQIVPCLYDYIKVDNGKVTDNGRAFIVKTGDKYGLYDDCGTLVFPCNYDYIDYIIDDIYLTVQGDTETILDLKKTLNISWCEYQEIDSSCVDIYSQRADVFFYTGSTLCFDLFNIEYALHEEDEMNTDTLKALKWYLIAAELGDLLAINACYSAYKYGIGVKKNEEMAKGWSTKLPNGFLRE